MDDPACKWILITINCAIGGQKRKKPFKCNMVDEQPDPNVFANLLREVYASNMPTLQMNPMSISEIPLFTFSELLDGLRRMSNGRSTNAFGIMAEMIKGLQRNVQTKTF